MSETESPPLHKGQPKHGGPQGCNLPHLSNPQYPGCSRVLGGSSFKRHGHLYIPGSSRTTTDISNWGGAEVYYCTQYGCEVTGQANGSNISGSSLFNGSHFPNFLKIPYMGNVLPTYVSNPLQMTFTEKGRKISNWEFGRMWGFPDSGALFSLSLPGIGASYSIPVPLEGTDLILSTMHLAFQALKQT